MANEYTRKVLKQMAINCFDGCFLDEVCSSLGNKGKLSYSLNDLSSEVNRQITELEQRKLDAKNPLSKEVSEIKTLFYNKNSTEKRRLLIETLPRTMVPES